jgi:3-phosphoshikimate 1-carboxyvinyltransferase
VIGALRGSCKVPGDKSISHRAAILGALAGGISRVRGFSTAEDCASTVRAVGTLGVAVDRSANGDLLVHGPIEARPRDAGTVDCGRAGTAMRLLAGVAASLPITATLTGDPQLLARPMGRVADPLRRMGASMDLQDGSRAPMRVSGGSLTAIDYQLPVPSAQVKSAVLLAALRAEGRTTIREPSISRDHTERMLEAMGASISRGTGLVEIEPGTLEPIDILVPGDPSSAAFLWAAAAVVPGSDVTVRGVGLNPTRAGFLGVLRRMGGHVECSPTDGIEREGVDDRAAGGADDRSGEPAGDVRVRHAALTATVIEPSEVGRLVDELPLIGLLASQADGTTLVRGAAELRVKESDRIGSLVAGLRAMGADAEELPDGFAVHGPARLHGSIADGREDHRMAMTFVVAGLVADGPVWVEGLEFAADSFRGFQETLAKLAGDGSAAR